MTFPLSNMATKYPRYTSSLRVIPIPGPYRLSLEDQSWLSRNLLYLTVTCILLELIAIHSKLYIAFRRE